MIKLHDVLETSRQVYLVMEIVKGNSLAQFLKERTGRRMDELEAKKVFKQLLSAIDYIHSKNIVHRDIKLDNITIDSKTKKIKLVDFGLSCFASRNKKVRTFCGTPSYMAPELVLKQEHDPFMADMWASGVCIFTMLSGVFPFKGVTDMDLNS